MILKSYNTAFKYLSLPDNCTLQGDCMRGMTSLLPIPVVAVQVPASPSGWSAPLLFEASSLGLGATAGLSKVSTLLVLDTPQAVSDFLHTQVS